MFKSSVLPGVLFLYLSVGTSKNWILSNKNHFLLEKEGEGLLLPVEDMEYPLGMVFLTMRGDFQWHGWVWLIQNLKPVNKQTLNVHLTEKGTNFWKFVL